MDAVSGDELKIRGFETPLRTLVNLDQRIVVDGPDSGPGNLTAADFASNGLTQLPLAVPPVVWPPNAQPTVVLSRYDTAAPSSARYSLQSLLTNSVSYYLGPAQFNPTANNQGQPLVAGNTYFNTIENIDYIFTSAGNWVPIGAGAPTALKAYYYFPVVDVFQIPPDGPGTPDAHGNILSFDISGGAAAVDQILVYMNGALYCNGQDYTLVEGSAGSGDYINTTRNLCAGSVVEVLTFARPTVTFGTSAQAVNSAIWVFNGVTRTFPLRTPGGLPIVPQAVVNCLVSLGNRIANPYSEFTVLGSDIIFTTAPVAGTSVWAVVGLPVGGADPAIADLQSQITALEARITVLEGA